MSGFIFHKDTSFLGSYFGSRAAFDGAVFNGVAEFNGCTFCGPAGFDSSKFCGPARFLFAIFEGSLRFGKCEFSGPAWFMNATFKKFVWLGSAIFSDESRFTGSSFESFAKFPEAIFKSATNFSDSQFGGPTTFLEAQFSTRFPKLSGAILHQNTTFTAKSQFWPDTVNAPAEESRESLAIIRHAVGKQGLPEEEHYFFRREMAFAARIGSPLQRLPYQAFGALSDFGYSLAKPALWLGGSWFIGFLAYAYWLTWLAPTLADAHPLFTAAGFSVAQLFGFLGFTGSYFGTDFLDALPTALKVLAGFQTVAGVVLLFFLGLGLRNRFRLK